MAKFDRARDFERRGRAEHLELSDRKFRMRKARVEGLGIRPGKVGDMNRELLHVALGLELGGPGERPAGAKRSAHGDLRVEAAIEEGANPRRGLEAGKVAAEIHGPIVPRFGVGSYSERAPGSLAPACQARFIALPLETSAQIADGRALQLESVETPIRGKLQVRRHSSALNVEAR